MKPCSNASSQSCRGTKRHFQAMFSPSISTTPTVVRGSGPISRFRSFSTTSSGVGSQELLSPSSPSAVYDTASLKSRLDSVERCLPHTALRQASTPSVFRAAPKFRTESLTSVISDMDRSSSQGFYTDLATPEQEDEVFDATLMQVADPEPTEPMDAVSDRPFVRFSENVSVALPAEGPLPLSLPQHGEEESDCLSDVMFSRTSSEERSSSCRAALFDRLDCSSSWPRDAMRFGIQSCSPGGVAAPARPSSRCNARPPHVVGEERPCEMRRTNNRFSPMLASRRRTADEVTLRFRERGSSVSGSHKLSSRSVTAAADYAGHSACETEDLDGLSPACVFQMSDAGRAKSLSCEPGPPAMMSPSVARRQLSDIPVCAPLAASPPALHQMASLVCWTICCLSFLSDAFLFGYHVLFLFCISCILKDLADRQDIQR